MSVEEVVTEDETDRLPGNELFRDEQCLGDALGLGLRGIADADTPLGAIAKEPREQRAVFRGGNQQDIAQPREHERREGVVHERFVVERQQLLGADHRQRPQP